MTHEEFLRSLTEQAAGNVYKKNSVMGKRKLNETFVNPQERQLNEAPFPPHDQFGGLEGGPPMPAPPNPQPNRQPNGHAFLANFAKQYPKEWQILNDKHGEGRLMRIYRDMSPDMDQYKMTKGLIKHANALSSSPQRQSPAKVIANNPANGPVRFSDVFPTPNSLFGDPVVPKSESL